jgi:hypothetical protein
MIGEQDVEAWRRTMSDEVHRLSLALALLETKVELMQGRIDFYQEMFEVTRTRRGENDH